MSHKSLAPAEAERLEMLAEEAGEIVQACMKALRHGLEDVNPDEGVTNRVHLMREIGDLCEVKRLMVKEGDVNDAIVADFAERKQDRMRKWTHHQRFDPEVRADDH